MRDSKIARNLCMFFGLCSGFANCEQRPLDNITSRQYQSEIRPLRLALEGWLHELGWQEFGA